MDAREEILSQIPLDQLAQQVGADEETTRQAAEHLIPTLLGGMQANAQDEQGAQSLFDALGEHAGQAPSLDQVDTQEGQKIVSHVLGANQDEVINQLGGLGGADSSILKKLLPILAPLVLNYLSGKVLGGKSGGASAGQATSQPTSTDGSQAPADTSSSPGTGGLGDILGSILGGMGGSSSGSGGSASGLPGGLGEILGSILGGGKSS